MKQFIHLSNGDYIHRKHLLAFVVILIAMGVAVILLMVMLAVIAYLIQMI